MKTLGDQGLFQLGEYMPFKPRKPCACPGCPNLTDGKYCDEHSHMSGSGYRKERNSFYDTAEWRRRRQEFLMERPFCEECRKEGRVSPAVIVDHIIPIRMGGAPLDASNLQGLCWSCHSRKSVKEGSRYRRKTYGY